MAELVKQMETAISAYVHNFTPVLTVKHLQMLALQTHVWMELLAKSLEQVIHTYVHAELVSQETIAKIKLLPVLTTHVKMVVSATWALVMVVHILVNAKLVTPEPIVKPLIHVLQTHA